MAFFKWCALKQGIMRKAKGDRRTQGVGSYFIALIILGVGFSWLISWYEKDQDVRNGLKPNLFAEFSGILIEILVFGVVLAWYQHSSEKRAFIRRYQNEIDDFKKWDSDESKFRIAGNIRRLAELGKTDVDLRGLVLTNVNLKELGIKSLKGAVFYDAEQGSETKRDTVCLTSVSFNDVNLTDVVFGNRHPLRIGDPYDFAHIELKDCSFIRANLCGAQFVGLDLIWTQPPPNDLYEYEQEDDGTSYSYKIHNSSFDEADLRGASFRNATIKNADFRGAKNILDADFEGVRGTAIFDDGILEKINEKHMKQSLPKIHVEKAETREIPEWKLNT